MRQLLTPTILVLLALSAASCGDKPEDTAPSVGEVDVDGDGYLVDDGDCDDDDASVHPGATESCNGVDDDCDGDTDEDDASDAPTWYADADADGWGDALSSSRACEAPTGFVADATDCDDDDSAVHPSADELCNGVDDDCDGDIDEDDAIDVLTWYQDHDGDGHGDPDVALTACAVTSGWVVDDTDCDDGDATIYEGAFERCDGLDTDCDGTVPEDEQDVDGDGVMGCAGDCDDSDMASGTDCFACSTYVPHDQPTIQDAIDSASDGDVVCVDAGTYVENIDFLGKAIHLYGLQAAALTIIDGGGVDSVVKCVSGEGADTVLEGFTISNGFGELGGGVRVEGSSPTLTRLIVSGNETERGGDGAGIYLYQSSSSLTHLDVSSNTAGLDGDGGGVALVESAASLSNLRVCDNEASEFAGAGYYYGTGGGVYCSDSAASLDNVLLCRNLAGEAGGGLYSEGEAIQASNLSVVENQAEFGGGIYLWESDSTFENAIVAANLASSPYTLSVGGGVLLRDSHALFQNATIVENALWAPSVTSGVGVYLSGSDAEFINTVFADNAGLDPSLPSDGGGVYVNSGTPSFSHCSAWGNEPNDYYGMDDPTGTEGNIAADPEFLDVSATSPINWDLHLDAGSMLIDAGTTLLLDPDGSASDMGAYGGPSASGWDLDGDGFYEWWSPGAYDAATSSGMDCDDQDTTIGPGSGC
jgi:hypothetical protein